MFSVTFFQVFFVKQQQEKKNNCKRNYKEKNVNMSLNDLNLYIVRRIPTQINYLDSIFFLRKMFALFFYV